MYYIAASDAHLDEKESKLLIDTASVLDDTCSCKGSFIRADKSKIN